MKKVNEKEFESEIKEGLTLVDFFATWCGPCRIMSSILEELDDQIKIVKVDVDECQSLARQFGIMSIPTLIFFKDGKSLEKHVGVMQREEIIEKINSYK